MSGPLAPAIASCMAWLSQSRYSCATALAACSLRCEAGVLTCPAVLADPPTQAASGPLVTPAASHEEPDYYVPVGGRRPVMYGSTIGASVLAKVVVMWLRSE